MRYAPWFRSRCIENHLVHYEFIRMPDSSGFGDYTESGQVISVEMPARAPRQLHSRNVSR